METKKAARKVFTIGLTGGIACGKSTVSAKLAALGCAVIDCDKIGHSIYAPGTPGFDQVRDAFKGVVGADGSIDRKALGAIVFGSKAEMDRLNAICRPLIREQVVREIERIGEAGKHRFVAVEAAILIEAGWARAYDEVWIVDVTPEIAKRRLMARNNFSDEVRSVHQALAAQFTGSAAVFQSQEATKRINSQMSRQKRCGVLSSIPVYLHCVLSCAQARARGRHH